MASGDSTFSHLTDPSVNYAHRDADADSEEDVKQVRASTMFRPGGLDRWVAKGITQSGGQQQQAVNNPQPDEDAIRKAIAPDKTTNSDGPYVLEDQFYKEYDNDDDVLAVAIHNIEVQERRRRRENSPT